MMPTQGWFWDLFSSGKSAPQTEEGNSRESRPISGAYRTLCVRLCDGFYVPVSASTTRHRFPIDAKRCEQSCPARSRLFVHHTGQEVATMVDLDGRPYAKLENAFRHQREYVADCTCRGNPWDQEALARHRAYAEARQRQPAKTSAKTERGPIDRSRAAAPLNKRQRWARGGTGREQDGD
jgi:Protein of unknown function (DUF2865)